MTLRAVLIGLLGAVFICAFGFFNDRVIRQTFITGNHMPISVYGFLMFFLLFVNPVLAVVGRRGSRSGGDGDAASPLLAGLVSAALGGLVAGLAAGVSEGLGTGIVVGLSVGTLVGFAAGVVAAVGSRLGSARMSPRPDSAEASSGHALRSLSRGGRPADGADWARRRTAQMLIGGLASGITVALVVGIARGVERGLVAGAATALACGLVWRLSTCLVPRVSSGELAGQLGALLAALAAAAAALVASDVEGALIAGVVAAGVGAALVLALELGLAAPAAAGTVAGLIAGLGTGLAAGPLVGLAAGAATGLLARTVTWALPGPLARRYGHLYAPLVAGLATAMVGGLATGVCVGLFAGLERGVIAAVVAGAVTGLAAGLLPATFGSAPAGGSPVGGAAGAVTGAAAALAVAWPLAGPAPAVIAAAVAGLFTGLASSRTSLTARELAVVVALILPACYIPGRGFIHIFTSVVMMPRHYEKTIPGWQRYDIVGMAPDVMLAGADPEFARDDVLRPDDVCRGLLGLAPDGEAPEAERRAAVEAVRRALPEDARASLEAALDKGEPGPMRRSASRALNSSLDRKVLYDGAAFPDSALSLEATELLAGGSAARISARRALPGQESREERAAVIEGLRPRELRRLNRHLVDSAFAGAVRSLSKKEDDAVTGFVQGLGEGAEHIAASDVPWYAWKRTLTRFWFPAVLCLAIAVIALSLVVHRQWSEYEHLPYPIVTFANSLLPGRGETRGSVFTDRSFLIAAGAVLALHLNNYAYQWWPKTFALIPTYFDFRSLSQFLPALRRGGDWALMNPDIYFTAIGFAYFVSSDVSFSLGIGPFLYATVVGKFAEYGVPLGGGGHISLKAEGFIYGGSHFGMFMVILYTGRRYFSAVFRRCVGLSSSDDVPPSAVWGARVFLASTALFVLLLVMVGLDWPLALLYTGITIVLFVVMTRVVAEAGVFFIHPYAYPGVLLWGFLGARAVGPGNLLIMLIVTTVLVIDPREAVMPFAVHALKLAEGRGVPLGRTALLGAFALLLGLAVAVPVTLYLQYDRGAVATGDGWTQGNPKFSYDAVVKVQDKLSAQGHLEDAGPVTPGPQRSRLDAGRLGGVERLGSVAPNWRGVVAFGVAAGLVILLTAARLRFPRWPFHPVMLIVLTTWASRKLAVSFLIGCLIKIAVTKYGGERAYRKLRPVMIGIIAGDVLGGVIPMVVGAVYYFAAGEPPKSFTVLPL